MNAIRSLGGAAIDGMRSIGLMGIFLVKAVLYSVVPPFKGYRILEQVRFIGFQSVLVIFLTGAFTGMVLSLQGFYTLSRFGSEAFLGPMLALSLIKQMGPVITGLMVTGRAGSAITAEIGIMRITDQIDALTLMGLNPFRYLVVPAFIAGIISLPLLTAIFDVVGIFGGYLVGVKVLGMGTGTYFGEMAHHVKMEHVLEGVYKSMSFGVIITWICCFKGFYAGTEGSGQAGVSKATTQGVVLASVMVLVWDYFMTAILF